MEDLRRELMDPNNINEKFQDEFNTPLDEEKVNLSDNETSKDNNELDEWREWALSYEDENGDVTDCD